MQRRSGTVHDGHHRVLDMAIQRHRGKRNGASELLPQSIAPKFGRSAWNNLDEIIALAGATPEEEQGYAEPPGHNKQTSKSFHRRRLDSQQPRHRPYTYTVSDP